MKAAVTTGQGSFEIADLPDPAPGEEQLVLKVVACGVCGSDLKAHGMMPGGIVMGHEFCGEVAAIGKGVSGWREGDNAAVLPVLSCGTCPYCLSGQVAHCASVRFLGMGPDGGGFAEYVIAPARHAFRVPGELPETYGALVEPLAVGLHSVMAGDITPASKVAIIGAGAVGLTAIIWVKLFGAERITAIDPLADRREHARSLGATDVLASADDMAPDSYDVVIECSGHPTALDASIRVAKHCGRIVVAGVCSGTAPVNQVFAVVKGLTVRFVVAYRPLHFQKVVDTLVSGRLDPSPLIATTLGLGQLQRAFEMTAGAAEAGRILIDPQVLRI